MQGTHFLKQDTKTGETKETGTKNYEIIFLQILSD